MTASPANPAVAEIRRRVRAAYDELNRLIDGPLGTTPQERLYQAPAPGEWSIMENLAHIVEFMPYWADEIAQLVAEPGRRFGRTQQHEGRLRAISEHGHDTLQAIKAMLPASYEHLDRVLLSLKDRDLALSGQHVKFGSHTLAWFIEDLVTGHLEAHIEQIQRAMPQKPSS
ncbi:MAG: DinB family protein [Ktedonobacteraceae bacterium]|nr:DinB family protein [Ktedonobacteraceae bacterium]